MARSIFCAYSGVSFSAILGAHFLVAGSIFLRGGVYGGSIFVCVAMDWAVFVLGQHLKEAEPPARPDEQRTAGAGLGQHGEAAEREG